jgi:hypothetical protein
VPKTKTNKSSHFEKFVGEGFALKDSASQVEDLKLNQPEAAQKRSS